MDRASSKGFALLTTVWLSAVLALMALSIIGLTHSRSVTVSADERYAVADAAMQGALLLAVDSVYQRQRSDLSLPLELTGTIGDVEVSIAISSEADRLDLNFATARDLELLFDHFHVPGVAPRRLAYTVTAWRDGQDGGMAAGAAHVDAGEGRRHQFQSIGELLLIDGFPQALFECISPYVSVHSHTVPQPPIPADERAGAQSAEPRGARTSAIQPRSTLAGMLLRIELTGTMHDLHARKSAIVRLTGDTTKPFWMLAWSDAIDDLPQC